jgi:large subunit ribosomal protein L23
MKLNLYDIIKKPLLTEKSNSLESLGKYIFIVSPESNKAQIKKAIGQIFKVEVKGVNIINIHGKTKVFKGRKGKRSSFKKAIITTKDMKKIEFSKGV